MSLRRVARPLLEPALIVIVAAIAMRGFLFGGHLTGQHPDVMSFVLPRMCFLGRSLADGHLPLWNPLVQAGTPYLSDPQSGWLHAPAMLLFSLFGCGTAMRFMIALYPILAGLGTYWFGRKEGLHPVPATAGGLSAALLLGSSGIGASMPFSATLAWAPFVLVGASGFCSAAKLPRRLAYLGLGAFAWGQVAAAHMSHGLAMTTLLAAAYLAYRALDAGRSGQTTVLRAALLGLAFLAFLPLANLAMFVPRLALTSHTSLRDGYAGLNELAGALGGGNRTLAGRGVWAAWPLAVGSTPGAYAGAAILLSVPAAFRAWRKRGLAIALAATFAAAWILTLDAVVGWEWFRKLILGLPLGDFYLHNPGRLRNILLIVVPLLGALGIQSLIERPLAARRALAWLGWGAAIFLVLPVALGARPVRFGILTLGIAVTAPALVALAGGRRWAFTAVPVLLAVELAANALYGQAYRGGAIVLGLEDEVPWLEQEGTLVPGPLRYPDVDVDGFFAPGPIAATIGADDGRYLTWFPPDAFFTKGYLFSQQPENWPGLAMGRGMVFGVRDSMGYNPIQLSRYWEYVRAANELPIFYNASVIQVPTLEGARLLGIRYLTVPYGIPPPLPGRSAATESGWRLWEIEGWEPRVSVVADWTVVGGRDEAAAAVLRPGFDPARETVLEEEPVFPPTGGGASGPGEIKPTYREESPEDIRIAASAREPSLVVVRNSYDERWSASVDGEPAEVLPVDLFLQGVPVGPGAHEIRLVYRDPTIARGLLASALAWVALAAAIAGAVVVEHRSAGPGRRRARRRG